MFSKHDILFSWKITAVRFKSPVKRADRECWAYWVRGVVEKGPVKWAFSQKVKGSKSVK